MSIHIKHEIMKSRWGCESADSLTCWFFFGLALVDWLTEM